MEELLQKLLEAEVLTEETKGKLEEAFGTMLDEAKSAARDEATADVRAELTGEFVKQKDALVEALDTKVGEFIETEITELRADIERFRDLEAEHAEKLVEEKSQMAEELKNDLAGLIEHLDTFLEMRLAAEMEELREDLQEVRKNEMGRRVFEGIVAEYVENFADDNKAEATLKETSRRLKDAESQLVEAEAKLNENERTTKLSEVLTPLSGRQHDVMEAILKNVDTNQLEEAYTHFIGRVVRETEKPQTSEKEEKVLAEGESGGTSDKKDAKKIEEGIKLTGNKDETLMENDSGTIDESKAAHLRKLAGIS